jgi:hypothetical protein
VRGFWSLLGLIGAVASTALVPVFAQSVFQPSAPSMVAIPAPQTLSRAQSGAVFSPWSTSATSAPAPVVREIVPVSPPLITPPQPQRAPVASMPGWQWPEPDAGVAEGRRVNPWRPDTSPVPSPVQAGQKSTRNAANAAAGGDLDWLESNWQDYLERERQRSESARQREEWLQELRALQQRYPTLP